MEKLGQRPEHKQFFAFADKIGKRVNDIGAKRSSTARSGDSVIKRLFESTNGDIAKVTDEAIEETFDVVDEK